MVAIETGQRPILSPYKPFPITQELLQKAASGDEGAQTNVFELLKPRVHRYFTSRLPEAAEDLTQDTLMAVARGLNRLSSTGEGLFQERFTRSCFGIAKNVLNGALRRISTERELFVEMAPEVKNKSLSPDLPIDEDRGKTLLRTWFAEHLSEEQNQIVSPFSEGKSSEEIIKLLGITGSTLRLELRTARGIVEDTLLQPAGFLRIATFRDKSILGLTKYALNRAIGYGKLQAIKILGVYYTTQSYIDEYLASRRDNLNVTQFVEGYVFVGSHVTVSEYAVLRNNTKYRKLLVNINGRSYIKAADLEEFRRQRPKRKARNDGENGYRNLTELALTAIDYARYLRAIREGKLEAAREGTRWVTTPKAIQEYESSRVGLTLQTA